MVVFLILSFRDILEDLLRAWYKLKKEGKKERKKKNISFFKCVISLRKIGR
jgi:hypothetical protein